jgi:hypothetical protein
MDRRVEYPYRDRVSHFSHRPRYDEDRYYRPDDRFWPSHHHHHYHHDEIYRYPQPTLARGDHYEPRYRDSHRSSAKRQKARSLSPVKKKQQVKKESPSAPVSVPEEVKAVEQEEQEEQKEQKEQKEEIVVIKEAVISLESDDEEFSIPEPPVKKVQPKQEEKKKREKQEEEEEGTQQKRKRRDESPEKRWSAHSTSKGHTYYYDNGTRQSSWEKPRPTSDIARRWSEKREKRLGETSHRQRHHRR